MGKQEREKKIDTHLLLAFRKALLLEILDSQAAVFSKLGKVDHFHYLFSYVCKVQIIEWVQSVYRRQRSKKKEMAVL